MKFITSGSFYRVLPDHSKEERLLKHCLMGWKQKRNDPWITAEDNLVNRMVLGVNYDFVYMQDSPQCDDTRLADYQKVDVQRMCNLRHCLNANPMGLGKTVETIMVLKAADAKSVCITCPKIIRTQWVNQIERWWGRTDVEIYEKQATLEPGKIYVVNYDKMRNEQILTKFRRFRWDFLVLDESHKIKSHDSKTSIAMKCIPSARRLLLSGTPILRYVDDLWSQLNFLGPEYSGKSYWTFVDYFCKIERTPWGNKIIGTTEDPYRKKMLNDLLGIFMIRQESVEVAHGKHIEIVKLPMTKPQRDLYRKERQLLLDQLPENCTIANGAVLAMRLRQTVSWPGLFLVNEPGPKFEWILEQYQNNPTEQFVVFSVFERTVTALQKYLSEHCIDSVTITGQNKWVVNENNKRRFLDGKAKLLLGTIGAMGQGYDELQTICHTMIFIDRDWSPEIMNQAEDRLHRMGQKYLVNIYYLECQGSFDQHVGRINVNKANGIREALGDEN